jgi:alkylhydroperoxidase family enzyme
MQHHLASSKRFGLGLGDWRALEKPLDSPRFSEQEKVALAYAEKLTRTPTNEIEPEASLARKHFSDEQLVDLTALIALANLTNRLTDGLGIDFEGKPEKI